MASFFQNAISRPTSSAKPVRTKPTQGPGSTGILACVDLKQKIFTPSRHHSFPLASAHAKAAAVHFSEMVFASKRLLLKLVLEEQSTTLEVIRGCYWSRAVLNLNFRMARHTFAIRSGWRVGRF